MDMALVKTGIISSCPRVLEKTCQEQSCNRGSMCVDKWFSSMCHCKEDFTGERCDESKYLIQYNAMQCNAMQCNAMQCNAMVIVM